MGMRSRRRLRLRTPQPEWHTNLNNLAALYEWLAERGEEPAPRDVSRYIEKPWTWEPEWQLYQRWLAGERCPAEDCPFLADECSLHRELHGEEGPYDRAERDRRGG